MTDRFTAISTNIATWFTECIHWIRDHLAVIVHLFLIVALAFVIARIASLVLTKLLQRALRVELFPTKTDRDRRLRTLGSIATALVNIFVWAAAFVTVLNTVGVNTAPLLASAGILGIAIGFGAQSLVRDFVSGMFIIAENQYRVGDYVEIKNIKGTVKSVSIRTTVIQDDDGAMFHIPNGSIVVTGNHTMNNDKVGLEITASTDTDIDQLCSIINKIGLEQTKLPEFSEAIHEPIQFKRIKDIKSGTVVIRLTGRVKAGKQIEVKSYFYKTLQSELVKQKIALK